MTPAEMLVEQMPTVPPALPAAGVEPAGGSILAGAPEFVLAPGDELEILFMTAPELNQRQVIRPDGRIVLPLTGTITAAGRTPSELQQALSRQYASELRDPDILVLLRRGAERQVFVGGSVLRPGVIRYATGEAHTGVGDVLSLHAPLSVLQAVMLTGGFDTMTACRENVIVIRHGTNGARQTFSVDLSEPLQELGQAFYLQPYDVVYVPQNRISRVNQWVEQHINRILPRSLLFRRDYVLEDGVRAVGVAP